MNIDLDPRLLRAFLTVCESGTVSGAAERLARTQAAVSMQIQRLEESLGTTLLRRSPRGVAPTENGEIIAAYARKVLALGEDARQQIAQRRLAGRVRLGILEDLASTRLPGLLAEFRRRCPEVEIDLLTSSSDELAQAIEGGRCDLVIADPARFRSRPRFYWSRRLVWAASRLLDVDEAAPLRLVVFAGSCSWQDRATTALAQRGIEWVVGCRVATYGAMIAAVRAGLGLGLMLPESVPPDCAPVAAQRLPPPAAADFGVFWAPRPSPVVERLAAFLHDGMA